MSIAFSNSLWKFISIFPDTSSSFRHYTHSHHNIHCPHHHATLIRCHHNHHHLHRLSTWSNLTSLHSDLVFSLTLLTTSFYPLHNPWSSFLCPIYILRLISIWWWCWELRRIERQRKRRLFAVKRGREMIEWSEKEKNEKKKKRMQWWNGI